MSKRTAQPNVMQTTVALITAIHSGQIEQVGEIMEAYAGPRRGRTIRLVALSSALVSLLGAQLQHEEQVHGHDISEWLENMGQRFA